MTEEMNATLRFFGLTVIAFGSVVALHGFLPPVAVAVIVALLGAGLVIVGTHKDELFAYLVPLGAAIIALVMGWGAS
jgi:TolB-like protein